MSEEIIIQRATADDWEQAMEVAWRTFLKYEAPDYSKEGIDNFLRFISDEKLFKMFLLGNYVVYVAKCSNKVIGVGTMRSGNHISLLFVDSEYQKRGVGKALLSELQKSVSVKGESSVITVNAAPFAIPFYERIGFLKSGEMTTLEGIIYQPMTLLKTIV